MTDDDREFARALVESQIAFARLHGLKMYLLPKIAEATRKAGIWADDVMIETKPIPYGISPGMAALQKVYAANAEVVHRLRELDGKTIG